MAVNYALKSFMEQAPGDTATLKVMMQSPDASIINSWWCALAIVGTRDLIWNTYLGYKILWFSTL